MKIPIRKSNRVTRDDLTLVQVLEKGRKEKKPNTRKERKKRRQELGKRREAYEQKQPYERWEAGKRWKERRQDPKSLRRQENQEKRRPWLKERMETYEDEIRHYERKPRRYTEGTNGSPTDEERVSREKTQTEKGTDVGEGDRTEEWGRWKRYRKGETEQIRVWKKGVLGKKGRQPGKGSEWRAWERSTYVSKDQPRRTRHENRRKVRMTEYKMPKRYGEVVDKGKTLPGEFGGTGRDTRNPWRWRGLETRKNPYEPKGRSSAQGPSEETLDRHETQRVYEERSQEVQGNFSRKRKMNYEERREAKAWKKRKGYGKKALRWSPKKERHRRQRREEKRKDPNGEEEKG